MHSFLLSIRLSDSPFVTASFTLSCLYTFSYKKTISTSFWSYLSAYPPFTFSLYLPLFFFPVLFVILSDWYLSPPSILNTFSTKRRLNTFWPHILASNKSTVIEPLTSWLCRDCANRDTTTNAWKKSAAIFSWLKRHSVELWFCL